MPRVPCWFAVALYLLALTGWCGVAVLLAEVLNQGVCPCH